MEGKPFLFTGWPARLNCELPKIQNSTLMFPILPLFVEASGSGTAEADNGFDAVLPFDHGVVAMTTVRHFPAFSGHLNKSQ